MTAETSTTLAQPSLTEGLLRYLQQGRDALLRSLDGLADVLRESVDGRGGRDHDEMGGKEWWTAHLARIQAAADAHRDAPVGTEAGS